MSHAAKEHVKYYNFEIATQGMINAIEYANTN